jgi:hypothetical protein
MSVCACVFCACEGEFIFVGVCLGQKKSGQEIVKESGREGGRGEIRRGRDSKIRQVVPEHAHL